VYAQTGIALKVNVPQALETRSPSLRISACKGLSCANASEDGAYAPFGESYAETGTTDRSFTGQNQDTVSGLDDFMFREYSASQQGRWISPDPAGLDAVNLSDPQSLNRYSYAYNRPCGLVDIAGLSPCTLTIAGADGLPTGSQTELNRILGPNINAVFTQSSKADFTLKQNVALGANELGYAVPGNREIDLNNSAFTYWFDVYANSDVQLYPPVAYDLGLGYGRAIAHEIGHKFLGSGHPGGVMSDLSQQGSQIFDPSASSFFQFIKKQSQVLGKRCNNLHSNHPPQMGGGGSGGITSNWRWLSFTSNFTDENGLNPNLNFWLGGFNGFFGEANTGIGAPWIRR
jgi:RHS repeat-associated protein